MSKADSIEAPMVQVGVQTLEMSRGLLMMLVEDLTDEQMVTIPCAGANHAAWILGHLAIADDSFRSFFDGSGEKQLDPSWGELYGMGTQAQPDRATYPSKDELLAVVHERREALIEAIAGLSDEQMRAPVEGEMAQFAKTWGQLVNGVAFHEGMHAGQLSVVRRALGMAPKF